jgi:hypothetical protein
VLSNGRTTIYPYSFQKSRRGTEDEPIIRSLIYYLKHQHRELSYCSICQFSSRYPAADDCEGQIDRNDLGEARLRMYLAPPLLLGIFPNSSPYSSPHLSDFSDNFLPPGHKREYGSYQLIASLTYLGNIYAMMTGI